ncbi:helicase-associated domain-containing protein [Luteimicrobium subarcticum]|uniref:XPB/Ssl2-like helicase family protein n=1 Tax=Luteimicrobium subarcticum TaxID=620910 RepID=A0A2M8WW31_9MICO|nr:helicase-associated domain-containing protein [Luteimicrobium subarcticum]PJI95135.1 XPB/Ssl2-like helicase family protein [Luteimicrobium subarcticum]
MTDDVLAFLAGLDAADLARVLARSRSCLTSPPVRDLADLAARLQHPDVVTGALVESDAATLALVETVAALGAAADLDRVTDLLGTSLDAPGFQRALAVATGAVLVVPTPREGGIAANPGVRAVLVSPLGLGASAREALGDVPARELSKVVRRYGGEVPTRKDDLVEVVVDHLAQPENVRRALADAPTDVIATLEKIVATDRTVTARVPLAARVVRGSWEAGMLADELTGPPLGAHYRAAQWALEAGIAFRTTMATAVMPAEVRYALLPHDARAAFPADEPYLAAAPVDVRQSESAAAAALTSTVSAVTATLEAVGRHRLKLLKSGGVGAREVARLAKSTGIAASDVRFGLGIGLACGFFEADDGGIVTPTADLDRWRAGDPVDRVAELLDAWTRTPAVLSDERDEHGKAVAVGVGYDPSVLVARDLVLGRGADLPDGHGVVDADELVRNLRWWFPLGVNGEAARASWDEAERWGAVALGRVTRLGRALVRVEDLADPLVDMLPARTDTVAVGSDLTVVVAGSPSAGVTDFLDAVGRRETHGAASVWRLSAVTVRDALDAGYTGAEVTERLRDLAGKDLPQPVRYLVDDVARRHGHLRVRPAQAVVVCEDEALLAEVVAEVGTRTLGLRLVAPTVAVAQADVGRVLERLRAVGHLPAEVDADGVVRVPARPGVSGLGSGPGSDAVVAAPGGEPVGEAVGDTAAEDRLAALREWAEQAGIEMPDGRPEWRAAPPESPTALAARLVAGLPPAGELTDDEIVARLARHAKRLTDPEVRELAQAVAKGGAVRIRYRGQSGRVTERVVSEVTQVEHLLVGWCHLREAERMFALDRIERVVLGGP